MSDYPNIWRINLKPASRKEGRQPFEFCLNTGIIGVGWSISESENHLNWAQYELLAKDKYPKSSSWKAATNALRGMKIGDLCWARDRKGLYYVAQITGDWEYRSGRDYYEHDIVNVRNCKWEKIGTVDEIPGKVEASFRPARTLQRVYGESVCRYTASIFNKKTGNNYFSDISNINLFELLSADDCEDLLGVYMQLKGFVIIPSSCKKHTQAIEWVAYNKEDGTKATAQVKTGSVMLNAQNYLEVGLGKVFLFSPNQKRPLTVPANVVWIEAHEIIEMIRLHRNVLPKRVLHWISINNDTVNKTTNNAKITAVG